MALSVMTLSMIASKRGELAIRHQAPTTGRMVSHDL